MNKLDIKQKDEINAKGFISSLLGFGGWGLATTAASIIAGVTGLTTNALNISNSVKRAKPYSYHSNENMFLSRKLNYKINLFHAI